jgi:hypothetical protein
MSLVVNQDPAAHEQLAALLEGLRAFKGKK